MKAIQTVKAAIKKESISHDTLDALESLEHMHDHMVMQVDALYASLNVCDKFPELQGISLDFVWILLLAHNLKINIRKQAIRSFFRWDKLDQAIGGAQQALGKFHSLRNKTGVLIMIQEQNFINKHGKRLQNNSLHS